MYICIRIMFNIGCLNIIILTIDMQNDIQQIDIFYTAKWRNVGTEVRRITLKILQFFKN